MPKTIFITGASTGLGRATAELFAERGWNVIAEKVFAAANDEDRVSYVVGDDALQWFDQHRTVGAETFRRNIRQTIFGA